MAFLNTTLSADAVQRLGNDQTSGKPADLSKRATTKGIQSSSDSHALQFYEYNTMDDQGNVISPESNVMTFTASDSKSYETILLPDETERFKLRNVYRDWTPDEDCRQVEVTSCQMEGNSLKWQTEATAKAFLIECDGTFVDIVDGTENSYTLTAPANQTTPSPRYTVRAANVMGGFGPATAANSSTRISQTFVSSLPGSYKYLQDGRIVIVRDNVRYSTTGQRILTDKK